MFLELIRYLDSAILKGSQESRLWTISVQYNLFP
jgi:hypothetical protein